MSRKKDRGTLCEEVNTSRYVTAFFDQSDSTCQKSDQTLYSLMCKKIESLIDIRSPFPTQPRHMSVTI